LSLTKKENSLDLHQFYNFLQNDNSSLNSDLVLNNDFNEYYATDARRASGTVSPLRLIKNPLLDDNFNNQELELFRLRFNDESSDAKHKNIPHTTYLTISQKRYKRKKSILNTKKFYYSEEEGKTKQVKHSYKPLLLNNAIFEDVTNKELSYNPTRQYRMLKKNKARSEVFSIVTNRRMLRTKRTLVIPAHVNITIISNSYDVVHS
jgi:hypothetical protein